MPTQEPKTGAAARPFDYAGYFGQINVLGDLLRDGVERPWLTSMPESPERKQFVVWLGCNVLRTVHLVETLDDVLKHLGVDYVMLGGPSACCGIVHDHNGQVASGRNMFDNTMGKFAAFQPERLLYWCPSCDAHLESLGADIPDLAAARQHMTEFFVEHLDLFQFVPPAEPTKIVLHAHRGTASQDRDAIATRRLLEAIPGLEVVELRALKELGRYCNDIKVPALSPERYATYVEEVAAEARALGASKIVTTYHSCHRTLCGAEDAADALGPLVVENYITVLARALGLPEHTDRFKRFKQIGDPERILVELQPRIEELGVAPERAARFITAQFRGPKA